MRVATFSRADSSLLGQWWWTVDRWTLLAIFLLMMVGVVLSMAASPAVAERLNLQSFYFVKRHVAMLLPAIVIMVGVSLLSLRATRRLCLLLFGVMVVCMILTYFWGAEIKGARRWLNIAGFSLQPSEFMKPTLAVLSAWMFGLYHEQKAVPGHLFSLGFYLLTVILLALQPDFGMIVVVSIFWFLQLFMAGLSLFWVFLGSGIGAVGALGAYYIFPHVAKRIDQFMDSGAGDPYGDRYQINRSLEAFSSGGLTGVGPGEGVVKKYIPDVHADFVFAVAAEEFGFFFCLLILGLYGFIIVRTLTRIWQSHNFFIILATTGLIAQFGLQTIINMSSSLRLMPTKGMTLPFISYGGSSILATAILFGIVLGLTRKRVHPGG